MHICSSHTSMDGRRKCSLDKLALSLFTGPFSESRKCKKQNIVVSLCCSLNQNISFYIFILLFLCFWGVWAEAC